VFNVILITIDSLRSDMIGCYNKNSKLTPNIDKFASMCVIFKHVIAQGPRTPCSFPAILSGIYSYRFNDIYFSLSKERPLISEILKKYNYNTAAFNSNPYISKAADYDRGFDIFDDNLLIKAETEGIKRKFQLMLIKLKAAFLESYLCAPKLNRRVISWVKKLHIRFFIGPLYGSAWTVLCKRKNLVIWSFESI